MLHEHRVPDQGLALLFFKALFSKICNVSVPSNKCHALRSACSFNLFVTVTAELVGPSDSWDNK